MVNAKQEAHDRLGGAYEVRVLEPSPPAATEPPWLADDPTDRGDVPEGRQVVSPVTTGDLAWDDLARDDPTLAAWCADRWLGAWRRLPPLPDGAALATTRAAWHALAEHVVAPARHATNGKIGLRYTRRGVGTPWFPGAHGDTQVRIEGTNLVVHRRETVSASITTVGAAAKLAGIEPGAPADVYTPSTPLEPDASLHVDPAAATFLGDWHGFAASVLEQLRAESGDGAAPSRVQLWPEHFDLSFDAGEEASRARGTFGASPADDAHPEPYLYVIPWADDVAPDPFWSDATFGGAALALPAFADAPDQRAAALEFFRIGRRILHAQ
jgi:hypothetical protein